MTLLAPDPARPAPLFADALAVHGDAVAVITPGSVLTYAELDRRVAETAARLGAGRRLVLLEAANTVESLVAYLAALRAGHPLMLFPGCDHETAAALLAAYDPDVVVGAASGCEPEERRSGSAHTLHPDLALLLATSGSTGSSKLVRLSRRNLQANATSIADYLSICSDDRAATSLPMHYCYGLSVINSHLAVGAGVVLTGNSVLDTCFWDQFRVAGATTFAGVPYTFELLDRVGFESMSLPTLRYVTQAGGRLHPDQVRRYAAMGERGGWQLFVMYGQTEATARMAYLPPSLAARHPRAIGVPIPGGSFSIEPLDEADAGDAGEGELVYRGPNVMLGYALGPDDLAVGATLDALRTGDIARRNADGLYEIVGRRSRFVKLYGLRIDLDHVERLVSATGTAALVTGDDDRLVVAVEAGGDGRSICDQVAERVGLPASRVRVVELAALPRLASGKPDYPAVLRAAQQEDGLPAPARPWRRGGLAGADEIAALFAAVLGREVDDDESFASAGGDSLSYVEASIRLEELLGTLPRDWHTTPLRDLAPAPRRRRVLHEMETSVVLRAVAIVLVVGSHAHLWHLLGGAHTLLGVAGYNFARFQRRSRGMVASIARVAVPSVCWIGLVAATGDRFAWPQALLVNGQLGGPHGDWAYWYVEALVQILVPLALVFAVPGVRRLEHRFPFAFSLAVVLAALAVRFDVVPVGPRDHPIERPHEVLWIFALGWAAAVASTTPRRALVSALVVAAVPGFFGAPQREAIVAGALLLVVWVPTLPVPWPVNRLVGTVAAASLYVFLTHWQVYPLLARQYGALVAVVGAVVAGILAWLVAQAIVTGIQGGLRRICVRRARRRRRPAAAGPRLAGGAVTR
ncbi:MAG: AMP-binding protein [Actinomycetota bacterium]|nr:AMP-binding protein [Actinomycetota bacterium]